MSEPYARLASKIEDAIDAVHYAKKVRDEECIEQFGDLDLILAELRSLHERASNTRFKAVGPGDRL